MLTAALAGRRLMLTGATGFIGKVTLAMILDRLPDVGRVYVLVRPRPGRDPEERFFDALQGSPVFEPLRERHGAGFEAYVRARVEVVAGDVTQPRFGLTPEGIEALKGHVDAVLNVAGLVSMNPGLDDSISVNARGARHAADFCRATGAKLVHMSTAYVAGLRQGEVREDEPILGYRPPAGAGEFDAAAELASCERALEDVREQAAGSQAAALREQAIRRLLEKGKPVSEPAIAAATGRLARRWVDERLIEEGRRRARAWGWPNVYCYTKSIGEQLIAAAPGLDYTIVRPSIVESALAFPFPGWNEGLTTSAPMILAMCTGHALWPAHPKAALDVIPVDMVAAGTLIAAAGLLSGRRQRVYHLTSSGSNPFAVRRCMRYVGEYRRRHYRDHAPEALWSQWLWTRLNVITVSEPTYRRFGVPAFRRAAAVLGFSKAEHDLGQVEHVVSTFLPFIHDIDCVFRSEGLSALRASMDDAERAALAWEPEAIDWRHYWFDVHTEGLRRWVFPGFPARNGGPLRPAWAPAINRFIKRSIELGQDVFYGAAFSTEVVGREHVPDAPGFLVAANHVSHLDMGLARHGLGAVGRDLVAMAARDYFFGNAVVSRLLKTYTNLLPIGRTGAVKDALSAAGRVMKEGRSVLIFPEATRSTSGEIGPFKSTVGYLALQNKADVLPAYLDGTFRALPKGAVFPRARRLAVRFGPVISQAELRRAVDGLPPKEAYRAAAALIEAAVRRLEVEARARETCRVASR